MRFRHEWLILPLFFIVFRVFSQEPSFRNFSVDQGLPSSECYQILQSKEGYIWVVTDNGVAKFDGYKFHVYNRKNGLPENTVFRLHEDAHGRIWFVCASGSMAVYENGKLFSLPESVNRRLRQYIKYGLINSVASYKDTVYLGYSSTSVSLKLVKNRTTFKLLQNKRHTKRGAYIQLLPNKQIVCGWITFPDDKINKTCRISGLEKDYSTENMFVSDVSWWFRAYFFSKNIYTIHGNAITYILPGSHDCRRVDFASKIIHLKYKLNKHDHRLWVATTDGLYVYPDLTHFKNPVTYLKGRAISDIIQDNEGGMWISTLNGGIYYCKNFAIRNFTTKGRIFSIAERKGTLYLGLENGGLAQKKGRTINYFKILKNDLGYPIAKIIPYSDDQLLLRFQILLNYSFKKRQVVSQFDEYYIRDFYWDTINRKTWGLGGNTVFEIDQSMSNKTPVFKVKDGKFSCISITSSGNILIGGDNGLGEFDLKKRKFHYLNQTIKNIRCIAVSKEVIWSGSKEEGIQIRRGKQIFNLNMSNGFKTDYYSDIFLEKPTIGWLSTNKGIAKVTIQSWKPFRFRCQFLTKKDGLISDEILQTIKVGDKVITVGNGGYSEFHSDALSLPVYQPKVFLTGVKINNGKVAVDSGKSLRLTNSGSDLRVDFMSLCFRKEGAILYRYRLEGVDQQWKYTKSTFAEYNTLPAGKLTFKVQAQSTSGMWDTPVTTQTFYVPVPFIERWYIRVGILMLLTTLIWLFVRWRIRRVQKRATDRETLLQKASEMELKFLTGQMNPHFTFNAMNSIQHFMLDNDLLGAQKYLTKYSKLIRNVLESNMQDYVSVDKELNLLQLYIEIESLRFSKAIRFELDCPEELRLTLSIPPMFIQPYIENAIWHGLFSDRITDACITLKISLEEHFLKCIVEDNGIGRAEAMKKNEKNGRQSLGMLITHKRLDTIGKENFKEPEIIDLTDEHGNATGTRVVLYLPFRQH
jgi:ligand-binding sensor domain-containing protein